MANMKRAGEFLWPNDIVPPVYFANAQWAVTDYGLECLTEAYAIERDRLTERWHDDATVSDWVMHLADRDWCDLDYLCEAFDVALRHHRVKGRTLINLQLSRRRAEHERVQDALAEVAARVGGLGPTATRSDLDILRQLLAEERAEAERGGRADIAAQVENLTLRGETVRAIAGRLGVDKSSVNRMQQRLKGNAPLRRVK
jgi:hypothetical protein